MVTARSSRRCIPLLPGTRPQAASNAGTKRVKRESTGPGAIAIGRWRREASGKVRMATKQTNTSKPKAPTQKPQKSAGSAKNGSSNGSANASSNSSGKGSRQGATKAAATKTSAPMAEPKSKFPPQKQDGPGLEQDIDSQPRWRGERYRPANKLEGQVAIVTGGDSGIGRAVAYFFAREGADVAITCLPVEMPDAEEVKDAIEELGRRCLIIEADFREPEACDAVIDRTLNELGKIDILVHNAAHQNRKKIEDLDDEEMDATLKVNVYAYLRLARAAVPHMKAGGVIIATGSRVGLDGSAELPDYGASKGAIHAITKCLARQLNEKQIRVNCVAPGPVWTPLNIADEGTTAEEVAGFGKDFGKSEMGRPAQPEELAPAYVYLASNADSSYVTGVVLPVTGEPN